MGDFTFWEAVAAIMTEWVWTLEPKGLDASPSSPFDDPCSSLKDTDYRYFETVPDFEISASFIHRKYYTIYREFTIIAEPISTLF